MAPSIPMRPLTHNDLREMPDDGNRYELLFGELFVTAAPSVNHERLTMQLVAMIAAHLPPDAAGEILTAPVDVNLSMHSTVQPDLMFIREDRIEQLDHEAETVGAPDLVVEIISPSSRGMDRFRKAVAYGDAGVPEFWLVDPMQLTVEIMTLKAGQYEPFAAREDGRVASLVLPGLVVDPVALFARLRP